MHPNSLALSSFGFSKAHCCFAFFSSCNQSFLFSWSFLLYWLSRDMVWEELVFSLSSIWHPWHISGHKITSSCMYSWASKWESLALVTTWSTLEKSSTSRLLFFFVLVVGVGALGFVAHSNTRRVIVDNFARSISRCLGVSRRMQYFYHQIPDIKDGNNIHAQTSFQRNNFRIQLNCETLKFASYTCNLWEQKFDIRKYIGFLPRLTWSLQGLQQNLSLKFCFLPDILMSSHVYRWE